MTARELEILRLVAGGLSRRAGPRELESLLAPTAARAFHGAVEVHDAEDPELVLVGTAGRTTAEKDDIKTYLAMVDVKQVRVITGTCK